MYSCIRKKEENKLKKIVEHLYICLYNNIMSFCFICYYFKLEVRDKHQYVYLEYISTRGGPRTKGHEIWKDFNGNSYSKMIFLYVSLKLYLDKSLKLRQRLKFWNSRYFNNGCREGSVFKIKIFTILYLYSHFIRYKGKCILCQLYCGLGHSARFLLKHKSILFDFY